MSENIVSYPLTHTFVISDAINTGWKFTKKYFWVLLGLLFLSTLPSIIENVFAIAIQQIPGATAAIVNPLTKMSETVPVGIWATMTNVLSIIVGVLGAWLGLGLIKGYLLILQDKKPSRNILTSAPWIMVFRFIGAMILVTILVVLGFIALIIPGIYIAARLSLVQYYIVEGYGVIDSIKASWAATKDNVGKIWGIGFAYFGLIILGVLTLGIGLLWVIPTISLAQAYVYTILKKNTPHELQPLQLPTTQILS